MGKYISSLLIAVLGLSSVVYGEEAGPACSVIKYVDLPTFQTLWPTILLRLTPAPETAAYCATIGATSEKCAVVSQNCPFATFTKVADLQSFSTSQFVINNGDVGTVQATVSVIISVNGTPIAKDLFHFTNFIDGSTLCSVSPDPGALQPNQTNFFILPNEDGFINRDDGPTAAITYNTVFAMNVDNGVVNNFSYLSTADVANPNSPTSTFSEIYYVLGDPTTCPANPAVMSEIMQGLPNLSDDLSREWELEGGVKMTGAQIRQALVGLRGPVTK